MKERCAIQVGKLIRHPCAASTSVRCTRCRVAICRAHRNEDGVCVVCSGDHDNKRGITQVTLDEMMGFSAVELAAFESEDAPSLHRYES